MLQVETAVKENPSKLDKGFSMNHGMDAKITHVTCASHEFHANVKDVNAEKGESGPDSLPTGQLATELNAESVKRLDQSDLDKGQPDIIPVEIQSHALPDNITNPDKTGPNNSEPKGTWTRINRMDFGLAGLTKAITISGLGKRDSRDVKERQHDEQLIKQGKASSAEGSMECRSAGVENHPCREQ